MNQLLKTYIEKYAEEYDEIKKQFSEIEGDWKDTVTYARKFSKSVQENQILFWSKGARACEGTPRRIFDYLYQKYGEKYAYIWVTKTNKDCPKDLPEDVIFVKKKSTAYWEALACSKYLVGDGLLPASYVKKENQVYVSAMSEERNLNNDRETEDFDKASLVWKEMLKADKQIGQEEEIETVAEKMLQGEYSEENRRKSLKENVKKVLLFTNWSGMREKRYSTAYAAELLEQRECDVTIMARRGNDYQNAEFAALPGTGKKILFSRRMVLSKEETFLLQIAEKHTSVFLKDEKLRSCVREMMRREWRRICGGGIFDCVIVAGRLSLPVYLLFEALEGTQKILIEDNALPKIRRDNPEEWEKMLSIFDKIYLLGDAVKRLDYGEENQGKLSCLPVIKPEWGRDRDIDVGRVMEMDGRMYFIADCIKKGQCTKDYYFVELPEKGSCLIRAEKPLTAEKKEKLKQLEAEKPVYLFGDCAAEYKGFLKNPCVRMDVFSHRYLFMLPEAHQFFERLQSYCGDAEEEFDVIREVCKCYGVAII